MMSSLRFNKNPPRGLTIFEDTAAPTMEMTEARNGDVDLGEEPKVLATKEPEVQTRPLQVRVDWTRETDV
jgi:hypothetical protein